MEEQTIGTYKIIPSDRLEITESLINEDTIKLFDNINLSEVNFISNFESNILDYLENPSKGLNLQKIKMLNAGQLNYNSNTKELISNTKEELSHFNISYQPSVFLSEGKVTKELVNGNTVVNYRYTGYLPKLIVKLISLYNVELSEEYYQSLLNNESRVYINSLLMKLVEEYRKANLSHKDTFKLLRNI